MRAVSTSLGSNEALRISPKVRRNTMHPQRSARLHQTLPTTPPITSPTIRVVKITTATPMITRRQDESRNSTYPMIQSQPVPNLQPTARQTMLGPSLVEMTTAAVTAPAMIKFLLVTSRVLEPQRRDLDKKLLSGLVPLGGQLDLAKVPRPVTHNVRAPLLGPKNLE